MATKKSQTKQWYTSKTVWFNILTIFTVTASMFGYVPDQEVADTTSSVLLALSPIINLALRMITDKGLSLPTANLKG
jgi:hypothetical protein